MPVDVEGLIRDDRLWRRVGAGLGLGRVALGMVFWRAPVLSVRVAGLDRAVSPSADWLARMTAARDVAIGAGTFAATVSAADARGRVGWLLAGAVADLGDAVAITRGAREGRLSRLPARAAAGGAAGSALTGVVAAAREAWVATRPPVPRGAAAYRPR